MNPEMERIADTLDRLDIELFEAEKSDNLSAQISILRERSRVWKEWADILEKAGRENWPAVISSQRDAISADRLAEGFNQ